MQLKIDLHLHTTLSSDSSITIPQAIAIAKKRGLHGIAVTNHDSVTDLTPYVEDGFLLIPGIEVTTVDGHLLGIGVTWSIPRKLPAFQTAEKIREAGGLAVVPHPYSALAKRINWQIIEKGGFDGLEVMNASYPFFGYSSRKGLKLAEKLHLPQIGGSDSHIPNTIGDAYTVLEADGATVQAVLGALRSNRVHAEGRATSLIDQVKKAFSIAKLRLK